MLKKTIRYNNLDDVEVSRDFYFNLNKAEAIKWNFEREGGQAEYLEKIVRDNDKRGIVMFFDELIAMTIGERDGDNFRKSTQITENFINSEAYSVLFMELIGDEQKSAEFLKAILPKGLIEQAMREVAERDVQTIELPEDDRPAWERENRVPTHNELQTMTPEQLKSAFARRLGAGG